MRERGTFWPVVGRLISVMSARFSISHSFLQKFDGTKTYL